MVHASQLSYRQLFGILLSLFLLLLAASFVQAWVGPTQAPPGGNVASPINTSATSQTKFGNLQVLGKLGVGTSSPLAALDVRGTVSVDSLAVFGNIALPAGATLSFGDTTGPSGYGIKDEGGVLKFKSKDGDWKTLEEVTSAVLDAGGVTGSDSTYVTSQTQTYNVPGTHTWTNPRSGSMAIIECWGGGGGGGSFQGPAGPAPEAYGECGGYIDSSGYHPPSCTEAVVGNTAPGIGGGGGGGGYSTKILPLNALSSTVTVTVALGGSGGAPTTHGCSSGKAGTAGGASSFGTYVVANGGKGGAVGACSTLQTGTPLVSGNGGAGGTGDQPGGAGGKNTDGVSTTGCGSGGGASGRQDPNGGVPPQGGASGCKLSSPLNDAIQFGFGGDSFDFGANSGNGSWGIARQPGGGGAGGVPSIQVVSDGPTPGVYWTYNPAGQAGQYGHPGMCRITVS